MDLGPVGVNITHAVRHYRDARRLSYAELSRRLAALGRDIPPLGLRHLESGERRVDVDDLTAMAVALDVSPLALLLPTEDSALMTGGPTYSAARIWAWGKGQRPLADVADVYTFVRDSNPLEAAALTVAAAKLTGTGTLTATAVAHEAEETPK